MCVCVCKEGHAGQAVSSEVRVAHLYKSRQVVPLADRKTLFFSPYCEVCQDGRFTDFLHTHTHTHTHS